MLLGLALPIWRGKVMKVADILKTKGSAVKTVRPDETAKVFAEHLRNERIGAMNRQP
jgi:hypothetical protein